MSRQSLQLDPPDPAAAAARPDAPDASAWPALAQIVVIDDEPLNSVALKAFLQASGYQRVTRLTVSAAGTQALRDLQPDLVLLELALSGDGAFDVLQRMQDDRLLRHLPVIVLTAQDDRPSRLRALSLGAADFLVKPIDASELDLRLRNTLAAKAYRDGLAHTDQLTGLPNRESLLWQLNWALKHALRHGSVGAVLQLGLDRFGQINDALGPTIGDELLHAVAQRLVAGLRDSDTVMHRTAAPNALVLARGSGDEFTVLLPVMERDEDAALVARRMIERVAEPFAVAGQELYVSCRVGIAVFPGDSNDPDTILKLAGTAMRHARDSGAAPDAGPQFHSGRLNTRSLDRLTLERDLHHALEREEFRLHYQAQFNVVSGRLCGAEALVRWQHPRRGLLGPGEFIAVAEETGLIVRLGRWVLHEALRQLAAWRRDGQWLPQMSVNVSGLQLERPDFVDELRAELEASGVEGHSLCLELTESAIIDSGPQVIDMLARMKRLGLQLALDDFGTGYSSLTHLRRFPIDELKIDRSFVSDVCSSDTIAAITEAVIAMATRLGLRVVAEGVETEPQLAFVRASGADVFQGHLGARPLPAEAFAALLTVEALVVPEVALELQSH